METLGIINLILNIVAVSFSIVIFVFVVLKD